MTQKNTQPYRHHRENQRERILEIAEKLFIQKNLDSVSLSDIARSIKMTRNTLYEYFPNKQEIAWAIFQKIVEEWSIQNQDILLANEGSGFQQVEKMIKLLFGLLEAEPDHMRFIVEFNMLYAREGTPDRVRKIIVQTWEESYKKLPQLIRLGIADKSIRADIDPDLLSASILNTVNAVISRFALLGDLISDEYGIPAQDIYQEICRAFLRGIQAKTNELTHGGNE